MHLACSNSIGSSRLSPHGRRRYCVREPTVIVVIVVIIVVILIFVKLVSSENNAATSSSWAAHCEMAMPLSTVAIVQDTLDLSEQIRDAKMQVCVIAVCIDAMCVLLRSALSGCYGDIFHSSAGCGLLACF